MSTSGEKVYGVLAEFDGPNELLAAARKVHEAGYRRFDCHSPFPIHGMDTAMGVKRSPVGYIAGICGAIGGTGGYLLQWWTSSVDYPLVIAGKPFNSYQAFVPVTFGLTVLFAALGSVLAMLMLNRLPQWFHGVFYSERFTKVTDDGFFVSIEADDKKFNAEKTKAFLEAIGGSHVEVLKGA
ncbi:MAG: DUF3341 domain-containing protein [Candidatus Zixiibacteriota bacterium]